MIYAIKYMDIYCLVNQHYIIIKSIWIKVSLVPYPNPQKVGKLQKKFGFFSKFFVGHFPRIAPQHKEYLYEKDFADHSFYLYAYAFAFRVR